MVAGEDTIASIATAAGESGVAIVRMSGAEAVSIFEKVFHPKRARLPFESHRLMYGHIAYEGEMLDEAMGVVMRAPNSYTREDVCELHTHGGYAAATLTLHLLLALGARPAEPGEFTRRAFLNGRIDLTQAEAVMGVISARSAAALKCENEQLAGGQSRFLGEARKTLTGLLAGLEAHIDYPDEIDETEALHGLAEGLDALIQRLEQAVDERGARLMREGLRVTLCGRPNAGKSTLFNALLGEERAIVTDVPGTTRDVLTGALSLNGVLVELWDTAGLRESADAVERVGVARALDALSRADVALLLIDASRPLDDEDEAILRRNMPCPCAVVLTKEDEPSELTAADIEKHTALRPVIPISARTGDGLSDVRAYLSRFAAPPQNMLLMHQRHIVVAKQALSRLLQARETLQGGFPLDLAAVDMHEALYLLGRITGESVDEQLLDDVFSRFCVGK